MCIRDRVKARVKAGREKALLQAVEKRTLGAGSVAGDEYLHNMKEARVSAGGVVHWVETCFCRTPLEEERPYWAEFFDLLSVRDAHNRQNCRDWNGSEAWACCDWNCTARLEQRLRKTGEPFLKTLDGKV